MNATKQSAVELVPEVLCIHLKCFQQNGDKIMKHVQISLNICLRSFLCDRDYLNMNPDVNYRLVSAISHVDLQTRPLELIPKIITISTSMPKLRKFRTKTSLKGTTTFSSMNVGDQKSKSISSPIFHLCLEHLRSLQQR